MKTSESIGKIATALAKFQGEMKGVSKNAQGHGYKYMSFDAIMTLVRPELSKQELSIIQNVSGELVDGINVAFCETLILHSSGEWIKSDKLRIKPTAVKAGAPIGPREVGSALTYAKRYQVCGMLGICADTDDDAQVAQNKVAWGQVKTKDQSNLINSLIMAKGVTQTQFTQMVMENAINSRDYKSFTVEEANNLIQALNKLPDAPKTEQQGTNQKSA